MSIAITMQRAVEVGEIIAGEGPLHLAVDIYSPAPELLATPPLAFFCMPGGGINSKYYNLEVPGDTRYSFAQQMAARGFITIVINHLAIGGSSKPSDGFALTPEVMVTANTRAVQWLQQALQHGTLNDALPPLPDLRSIGVGHSMGGMLTVLQQAEARTYSAIAVLGFSPAGLPNIITPDEAEFVNDPASARANIVRLAKLRSPDAFIELNTGGGQAREIYGGRADRAALDALRVARDKILSVMGFFAILPGSTNDACAQIDVPVFLAVGDRDMTGTPQAMPPSFSSCKDISLLVLPETGHTHFIFPSCTQLYRRIAEWVQSVSA